MLSLDNFLHEKLDSLRNDNKLRSLVTADPKLKDFTSNDYLGLAQNELLAKQVSEKLKEVPGMSNGATGSRLLSGNSSYTIEVEKKLAKIFSGESALIFNSGYNANLSVLSSIPQKDDVILYDELVHASIKDGLRLSLAKRFPFRHNNVDDLEKKLERTNAKRKFIVIESIYSMDGDTSPLKNIVDVAQKQNAYLILDEAHSTGVLGVNGNGFAGTLGLQDKVDIRIYTFGKAMGVHGACVVGSKTLTDYLINTARPLIYTTALPPHSIVSIDCAFNFLKTNISLQAQLQNKVQLFTKNIKSINRVDSSSAIQCIIFSGNENVKRASAFLKENKFDVRPILSPTVPKDSERLRICLHTFNTDEDIVSLTNLLNSLQ